MSRARPLASIVVSASTSNLGPGFDTLGLALRLYLTVDVEAITQDERGEVRCVFNGEMPPGENLIARGFMAVCRAVGATDVASLDVTVTCDIPPGAGLGSSAAALVAGGRLAAMVVEDVEDQHLLDALSAEEGHPDNVAASVLGGLVAGCVDAHGHVVAIATPWPEGISIVMATPAHALATRAARAVLPHHLSREDAVYNLQRTALLLQAVATRRTDVLREAFRDRIHQPHRMSLVPGLPQALALQQPGLLGVFLSGAGPSIAACVEGPTRPVTDALRRIYETLETPVTIRVLDVHQPAVASSPAAVPPR